jgi:hypothetical protein
MDGKNIKLQIKAPIRLPEVEEDLAKKNKRLNEYIAKKFREEKHKKDRKDKDKKKLEFNYYDVYKDRDETIDNRDIVHKLEKAPFLFTNVHPKSYFERYNNTKQCEEANCVDANDDELVKEAFFSRENIEIVQNMIIKNVAKKSGKYIIARQKDVDVMILMNNVYHDYAKHLPYNLKEQVQELDDRVVNFITPWLINEIESYQNYLIDSNAPLRPPELPLNVVKQRKESLPSMFLPAR